MASAGVRGQLLWVLADGLLHGPRAESLAFLADIKLDGSCDLPTPLRSAFQNLVEAVGTMGRGSMERLVAEHTRLFAGLQQGVGLPPPYESVWRPRLEPGVATLAVTQSYAAAGFADIDLDAGAQDHLGVELKFMAMLALREAEARQQGDPIEAENRVAQQRTFLCDHLLDWVPRWNEELARHTEEPLYLALAALVWNVLDCAIEDLNAVVSG